MTPVIQTEDLTIQFGGLVAVNKVNFHLEQGEIRGLIGPNGSGKTTIGKRVAKLLGLEFHDCDLERLRIREDCLVESIRHFEQRFGRALGRVAQLADRMSRRGQRPLRSVRACAATFLELRPIATPRCAGCLKLRSMEP